MSDRPAWEITTVLIDGRRDLSVSFNGDRIGSVQSIRVEQNAGEPYPRVYLEILGRELDVNLKDVPEESVTVIKN